MADTGIKFARLNQEKFDILIAQRLDLIGQSRLCRIDRRDPQKPPFPGKRQNMLALNHIFGQRCQSLGRHLAGGQVLRLSA